MKKNILMKNIIFILFSMVCILLMYICYKLIANNKISNIPDVNIYPYNDHILNKSKKDYQLDNANEVMYRLNNINEPVNGLSKADLIIEYVNSDNELIYRTLHFNKKNNNTSSPKNTSQIKDFQIPDLNFIDKKDIYINEKKANFIFINLNDDFSSNFIFKNNKYYHYKPSTKHVDELNKEPVKVSNIILQMVSYKDDKEKITGTGNGFLFSNGKVIEIKWSKDKNSPIKITDKNGNNISLSKGNIWWLILDDHSSISYN